MMENQNLKKEQIHNNIISEISGKTGIHFRETHKTGIIRYIQNRINELKISIENYLELLNSNSDEMTALINASTVSETYFFREESQFNLVQKLIAGKSNINIWSAASAGGEEIFSLKLLCNSLNVTGDFVASDINTDKLEIIKNGIYNIKQATREIDGANFHYLLKPYLKDDTISFPKEMVNSIGTKQINLIDYNSYEKLENKKFNIVFLRNVFIYFSLEERYKILNLITDKYLMDDGYIFVSLSETAQIENKYLSSKLEKICLDNVFVFHKIHEKNQKNRGKL